MEFHCTAPRLCMHWWTRDLLNFFALVEKEVLTMWSLSFDFSIWKNNGFEGEIVAEKSEWGEEGGEEGLEALFTWTLNRDKVEGGVKRRIVLHSKVFFRARVRGEKKKEERVRRKVPRPCQIEDFLSLSMVYPPPQESGYEEGTVSITQIKWLLATLCWACPPFVDVVVSCSFFFPSISLPLLLSPLCLHLSPCSLYLVAKAFQAASSSLGILEAQQSPHTYTHIL